MHVACLARRYQHHTALGGYDRLAREVVATVVQRFEGPRLLRRVFLAIVTRKVPINLRHKR